MFITFGEVLQIGINRLKEAGIADAKRDAEEIMLFLMHEDRKFLFLHYKDGTDEDHADAYFSMVDRRAAGEPLQYIVGSQEFMGLPFEVNESVLIPRQDTESLVELALEKAKEKKRSLSVLDMCCGSGAIAVSVAHFLPKAKVTACDISAEALEVAERNAVKKRCGGENRNFCSQIIFFVRKRKKVIQMKETFDMILSNPPYVPTAVIGTLQKEIREHEPLGALDGGTDGLDFYRRIVKEAAVNLEKKGVPADGDRFGSGGGGNGASGSGTDLRRDRGASGSGRTGPDRVLQKTGSEVTAAAAEFEITSAKFSFLRENYLLFSFDGVILVKLSPE